MLQPVLNKLNVAVDRLDMRYSMYVCNVHRPTNHSKVLSGLLLLLLYPPMSYGYWGVCT